MRRFCLETVTKFTSSFLSNGIPDTISGAFRLRLGSDIFKLRQRCPNRVRTSKTYWRSRCIWSGSSDRHVSTPRTPEITTGGPPGWRQGMTRKCSNTDRFVQRICPGCGQRCLDGRKFVYSTLNHTGASDNNRYIRNQRRPSLPSTGSYRIVSGTADKTALSQDSVCAGGLPKTIVDHADQSLQRFVSLLL